MHHEDIKALLRKRGSSAAILARQLDVSRQFVGGVMRGISRSHRVAEAICKAAGTTAHSLWPGMYPHLEAAQASTSMAHAKKRGPAAHQNREIKGTAK